MNPVRIAPITALATHELRQSILRPHQTLAEMAYPGDDDSGTIHFGAFDREKLIGIVSLYVEPLPDEPQPTDLRFRGMAVDADRQLGGVGRLLIEACIAHARDAGGRVLWCNARTSAAGFYERLNFAQHGEIFDISAVGPHVVMTRDLNERSSNE